MLIGIDMLAVQASEGGNHEAGRYGRQLVDTILARNTSDQFILYAHDGLPTAQVASSTRRITRKGLEPIASVGPARLRATIQRLLDHNPDGLDWLVLLDPFAPLYGGVPPETPLGPLKVASVVLDLGAVRGDDRRLVPLRRHEAIFAVSSATSAQCRGRLGSASSRVATLNVAAVPGFNAPDLAEPLGKAAGDELGRLGIYGPFFLHVAGVNPSPGNIDAILDVYARLPIEHRHRHRLVITGPVDDPASIRSALFDKGIDDGLILAGDVSERTLRTLYGRCSAYLSPGVEESSGLFLVEAMRSGAPVIAGRTGSQVEIVGDAGLLVDPLDPDEAAGELAELLGNADLDRDLRKRSVARASAFGWDSAVDAVLAVLSDGQTPAATSTSSPGTSTVSTRLRFDAGHSVRPRIAFFPGLVLDRSGHPDLVGLIPSDWPKLYNVDFYFEPEQSGLADGLSIEFGGFDARLFDRNDGLLGYHAVVYRVGDASRLDRISGRLAGRPGLVLLEDDAFLDAIFPEPARSIALDRPDGWNVMTAPLPHHLRSDAAVARVRDILRTNSRVAVRSPRHFDLLHEALGEQAESIVLVPLDRAAEPIAPSRRASARARLDLWSDTVVIGQFANPDSGFDAILKPKAFRSILKAAANSVVLTFGSEQVQGKAKLALEAKRLGVGDRYLFASPVGPSQVLDVVAMLDLAIHDGGMSAELPILDLLRGGVATVLVGDEFPGHSAYRVRRSGRPKALARMIRDLAIDAEARAALARSGRDYALGVADPATASALLVEQVERCAQELPRASGRRVRRSVPGSPRRMTYNPHFSRPSSATNEAANGRGER